ncbi:MAG: 5-methyltetrahydropteroyltriglutamate--homocysteine S-methyltransferase [Lachnospiraceae bacterium]|nr:5-methyltetrahydropteroyltriglutamate--homocysteine S-methyltransferase [Lachnospiraceae bacterium]
MQSAVVGFPRIGKLRELKFASEKYFRGEISGQELKQVGKEIRKESWKWQKEQGISFISSNDFSFYDGVLDMALLLGAIPSDYKKLKLNELDTLFAMARGYQKRAGDVPALAMKKWFNTNYHYLVPELGKETKLTLSGTKPFEEYEEAKEQGVETKPVLLGPFTFLSLARYGKGAKAQDFVTDLIRAYQEIFHQFSSRGVQWVQLDEPALVKDLTADELKLFEGLYQQLTEKKEGLKLLLQTYFGDVRDCYDSLIQLKVDGIGLDFLEGRKNLELVTKKGFPQDKLLFAGLVNGKNIWKSDYEKVLGTLKEIQGHAGQVVLSTSCSLLHVPYTLENESKLTEEIKAHFSFAREKLEELKELAFLTECEDYTQEKEYLANQRLVKAKRCFQNEQVRVAVEGLTEKMLTRVPDRAEREKIQREEFQLPLFPTTTIGSFPQTKEVKKNRSLYKKGEIDKAAYDKQVYAFIAECISKQEEMGLDVLVHGEYERNDMVEFFGENLEGYVFTQKAWVQSYGTRCVKPPIIFGDVKRSCPITVDYSVFAQSRTKKPVKGMLTGPMTILNWSFPREDISLKEMAFQIGIAIREEVLDLEKAGIRIIQIDEAALKEKLPIRKSDWYSEYLDWAIPTFRLCHSGVRPTTQIHTHMCYSEFNEIIKDIDHMDADVISFEASRSKLTLLDAIRDSGFETQVGPGVYDIHSPRIPSLKEMKGTLDQMLKKVKPDKLWVNPDCGLKTRGMEETLPSLRNMVEAARLVREEAVRGK